MLKMESSMISGSIVALVTPMFEDGSLDWESLDNLLDFHLNNGTNAIVAVGTTGESATLDPSEHCKVIEHVVKKIDGRISYTLDRTSVGGSTKPFVTNP